VPVIWVKSAKNHLVKVLTKSAESLSFSSILSWLVAMQNQRKSLTVVYPFAETVLSGAGLIGDWKP
jgi:hypothetical protein